MNTDYTLTIGQREYKITYAVFFWIMVALSATYVACVVAAFQVISWFALIYLTIMPITINRVSLDPWPKFVSALLWASLIAFTGYYLYMI